MKTPKDLAQAFLRSADEFATKATTCKRLASGIGALDADLLGLTDKEQKALVEARALLGEIASRYVKAAKLKKQAQEVREKRQKDVRAAMKDTFDALETTADKVALIASIKPYTFAHDGLGMGNGRKTGDAEYLLGPYFNDCLDGIAYSTAASGAADIKDLAPAAAAAVIWQRFLERRPQLQDKYAVEIVRIDRQLAMPASGSPA